MDEHDRKRIAGYSDEDLSKYIKSIKDWLSYELTFRHAGYPHHASTYLRYALNEQYQRRSKNFN